MLTAGRQNKGQERHEEISDSFEGAYGLSEDHDEEGVRGPERTQPRDHEGGETNGRGGRGEGEGEADEGKRGAERGNPDDGYEEESREGSENEGD